MKSISHDIITPCQSTVNQAPPEMRTQQSIPQSHPLWLLQSHLLLWLIRLQSWLPSSPVQCRHIHLIPWIRSLQVHCSRCCLRMVPFHLRHWVSRETLLSLLQHLPVMRYQTWQVLLLLKQSFQAWNKELLLRCNNQSTR